MTERNIGKENIVGKSLNLKRNMRIVKSLKKPYKEGCSGIFEKQFWE